MNIEELKQAMSNFLDKECAIIAKDHPHANKAGRTIRIETNVLGKPYMVVRLHDGHECAVYKGSDLMFFGAPPKLSKKEETATIADLGQGSETTKFR